jgi:hypothetical protein
VPHKGRMTNNMTHDVNWLRDVVDRCWVLEMCSGQSSMYVCKRGGGRRCTIRQSLGLLYVQVQKCYVQHGAVICERL